MSPTQGMWQTHRPHCRESSKPYEPGHCACIGPPRYFPAPSCKRDVTDCTLDLITSAFCKQVIVTFQGGEYVGFRSEWPDHLSLCSIPSPRQAVQFRSPFSIRHFRKSEIKRCLKKYRQYFPAKIHRLKEGTHSAVPCHSGHRSCPDGVRFTGTSSVLSADRDRSRAF